MLTFFPIVTAAVAVPLAAGGFAAAGLLRLVVARPKNAGTTSITPRVSSFPEIEGLMELRNRLGLDVEQKTAWRKMEMATWDTVGAEQACWKKYCELVVVALGQGDFDMFALQTLGDRYFEEKRTFFSERASGWKAFFDELKPSQKEMVRSFCQVKLRQLSDGTVTRAETKGNADGVL